MRSSPRSSAWPSRASSITRDNLRIADNATLILSLHRELDALRESGSAGTKIGTTKRGIGPAYEDKVGRRAIRLMDLADLDTLPDKIERLLAHHNALRRGFGLEEFDAEGDLRRARLRRARRCCPTWTRSGASSTSERRAGKRILFEGAQGALLDVDHGTYPFVTSSNTVAGQAATGSGLGPGAVGYVLGIAKAYTTRVGEGPFPTELFDETGELIGQRGKEFGAVTGRKRRCGWFDAALVRQTVRTSGIDGIALTKLDILDGFETHQDLRRLPARRRDDRLFPGEPGRAGAGRADLRGDRGLERLDRRAPAPGPSFRRRRSNMSAGSRS